MNKFEQAEEIIGQALIDCMGLDSKNPEDKEILNTINEILNCTKDSYCVIQWPDVQELMDEEWFDEEAILADGEKFGGSAYFIPTIRLLEK